MRIAAPLQYVAAAVSRAASRTSSVSYVYLVDVKTDNDRLAYENARLRATHARARAAHDRKPRLRRLLGLRDTIQHETVSALVIGKDTTEFFRVSHLTVDARRASVRPNMPVIALDGAVGYGAACRRRRGRRPARGRQRLRRRRRRRAHRGARLRARHRRPRATRAVEYVQRTDEVEVGDLLVTSGVGCRFPKGIPVARVTKVVKRDFGIYQSVEAVPTVDFSRLEEVLIILVDTSDCEPEYALPGRRPRAAR